jgi:hypothetical protein
MLKDLLIREKSYRFCCNNKDILHIYDYLRLRRLSHRWCCHHGSVHLHYGFYIMREYF